MKDLASYLFKVEPVKLAPKPGAMLVAEPFIERSIFKHGVMTIIDCDPMEGATAVVMNNPTEYMLHELLDSIRPDLEIPVFCGGTTGQDRIFFVHTLGPDIIPGAREAADGLYVGGSFEAAAAYVNAGYPVGGCIRFFIGYTNWVEGQLEGEIAEGSWACATDAPDYVALLSGAGDSYWHGAVRSLGENYRPWTLIPRNPVCN